MPEAWDPKQPGFLEDGRNLVPIANGKLAVRGGSSVAAQLAHDAISDVLGLWPFSPTGALLIAHSATNAKHYAYALTDTLGFALPNLNATELGSRVELGDGWATAAPGRPNGAELFEKLYIGDANDTNRRPQVALSVAGGALVATTTSYDLDGTPGNEAPMRPYCIEAFASVIFAFGYDSESGGIAPALGRHSFLGIDPVDPTGFDKDAYNTFGAQGQTVRAAKAGNTILLAAKENELYRITGAGRGLPGWQFSFQPLNDSEGRGCSSADALAHVDGNWYGAGRAGPFITDGTSVVDIQPPRRRSWASVDLLSAAWVRPHPDRQTVLFGFHVSGDSSRPAKPFELWQWDLVRETWAPSWRFPRSFHVIAAIATGASAGPSDIPAGAVQSLDFGEFEFTAVSGTFNAGDLSATTEVWGRQADSPSVLKATLPPGVQRYRADADTSRALFVKLRHVKGSAVGEFSGEVPHYTRLLAPQVAVGTPSNDGLVRADYLIYVDQSDLLAEDSSGFSEEIDAQPAGFVTEFDLPNDACYVDVPPDQGALYWAQTQRTDWPEDHTLSAIAECHTLAHKCAGDISTLAPDPRQRLEQGGMDDTTMAVTFFPSREGTEFRVQYRVHDGTDASLANDWQDGPSMTTPVAASGVALGLTELQLTGLQPSTRYDVRVLNVASGIGSFSPRIMFTRLGVPTINGASTAGTAGVPSVFITITPTAAGHDLFIYNAIGSFTALHGGVTGQASYHSGFGVCGAPDRYLVRTRDANWPDGYDFSLAATVDIDDPCAVGT